MLFISAVFSLFVFAQKENAKTARVFIDGELYREISLELYSEYNIDGRLTLTVDANGIRVSHSDCPDRICEKTGYISKSGQSIVCLPNGVSVTLSGEGEADVVT